MNISAPPRRHVILKQNKKRSFDGRHPWILQHSIHQPGSEPELGDVVDLIREEGKFVGRGLYNPNSRIRLRLYTWREEEQIDSAFFRGKLDQAVAHRARMIEHSGSSLRLVFSEADQLSGLIVDKFGEHLVIQVTSAALLPFVEGLSDRLYELYRPRSITLQLDSKTAKSEGVEPVSRVLLGAAPEEPIEIVENDLKWLIDLSAGQKTGYYLDQRENRLAVTRWIPEGGRVLDVCTYAGGFALHVAKYAKAGSITAIDSSERALQAALENAKLNGLEDRVDWVQGDFFTFLSDQVDAKEQYDTIILDPPRLASSRDHLDKAMAAYHRLNYLSLRLLRPGGTLVTCSCSGRVSRYDFLEMLRGVSQRAKREIQILESRGAAADHPFSISCPESDYLKCVIARVL